MSWNLTSCLFDRDCDSSEYCDGGYCVCGPTYFSYGGICRKCPGLGESCYFSQCCENIGMTCDSGICVCKFYMESSSICRSQIPLYITASQIALSAALIMGMAALTMVVYRLCTKPRYLSARQRAIAAQNGRNLNGDSLTYASYLRASLSSIQIRVLTRLRDRPPAYGSREAPRQPPASLPEAPPPYEGPTDGTSLPPNYAEVVLSTEGYVNSSFVHTEGGGSSTTNNDSNRQSNDCDNGRSPDGNSALNKVTEISIEDKAESTDENRIPT